MRSGGTYPTRRTWVMAPVPAPAETVLTTSIANEFDPVGEPNVSTDAFCTARVAPLGAEEAPRMAKSRVSTARTARIARGNEIAAGHAVRR